MYLLAPPGWQKRITLGTGPVGDGACQRRGLSKMGPARPTGPVLERPCPWQAPFPMLSSIATPEGLASNRRLSKKVNLIYFGFFNFFLSWLEKTCFLDLEITRVEVEIWFGSFQGLDLKKVERKNLVWTRPDPKLKRFPRPWIEKTRKLGQAPRLFRVLGQNSPH